MSIIDKYITKTFIKSLFMAAAVFTFIICITFIFDKLSVMSKYSATFVQLLISLAYSLPAWLSLIFPIAVLLAVLFSIGNLARFNEITALRTSGVGILRITSPVIYLGIFITVFFIFFNNTVMVSSNRKFSKIWRYEIKKQKYQIYEGFNVVQIEKGNIFSAKFIDGKNETISQLLILKLNDKFEITNTVAAKEAKWENGYLQLTGITESGMKDGDLTVSALNTGRIPFEKKPSEFITIKRNPDEMSYGEISGLSRRLKQSGIPSHKEDVYKYSKIARPFANIIMVLLGIPFAIKTARTAKIFSFSISIFTGFLYWGIESMGLAFGMNQTIPPFAAAWLSNFTFLAVGSVLFYKNR